MKNTKGSRVEFGRKVTIKIFENSTGATLIKVKSNGISNSASASVDKIFSGRTINFNDKRRQDAYKKINNSFGEVDIFVKQ